MRIEKTFPPVREEDVSAIGVKTTNFDASELREFKASHVNLFTSESLKTDGILTGHHRAAKPLPTPLYLHFDLEVMDAAEVPMLCRHTRRRTPPRWTKWGRSEFTM